MLKIIHISLYFFTFYILGHIEFSHFAEKMNIFIILSIGYFLLFTYLNNRLLNESRTPPFLILSILLTLLIYNWILYNPYLLSTVVTELFIFFYFDKIYNSIPLSTKDKYEQKNVPETKPIAISATPKRKDTYETIDLELEEYLVLFKLTHNYHLAHLKLRYAQLLKSEPKSNHKKIKQAKKYLETKLL